jgi:hypothetical protein
MQDRGRLAANADINKHGVEYARAFAAATAFSSDWFVVGYRKEVSALP